MYCKVCPHSKNETTHSYSSNAGLVCQGSIQWSNKCFVCRRHAGFGSPSDRPEPASCPELPLDSAESFRCCHKTGNTVMNTLKFHKGLSCLDALSPWRYLFIESHVIWWLKWIWNAFIHLFFPTQPVISPGGNGGSSGDFGPAAGQWWH